MNSDKKRKLSNTSIISLSDSNDDNDDDIKVIKIDDEKKQECKYGKDCYRKNPEHLKEFSHPKDDTKTFVSNRASNAEILKTNNYFYLTKVAGIQNDCKYSISISEILSNNDGDLIQSAQFNYMFDIIWLMNQYSKSNRDKPLLIIHGDRDDSGLRKEAKIFPHIKLVKAKLEIAYGTHHTKMMLLLYKTGLRVVIHTANLIEQDWYQKTQGVWISDLFPKCEEKTNTFQFDSKTFFKRDLINYLESYKDPSSMHEWIEIIKQHDMTTANVFLISSSPGRYIANKNNYGHLKLRNILSTYCNIEQNVKTKLVFQFSSIGSLGPNENSWLCKELFNSLNSSSKLSTIAHKKQKSASIDQINQESTKPICIYPSVENVRVSLEGYSAGGSLPYGKETAKKQIYFNNFLYQWKADCVKRTRASPHIKTYAKYSDDYKNLYWFLLTSSNLSKAAWGSFEKNETQLMIRSYELGVLFLPCFLKNDKENDKFFKINDEFLIPYDLPPLKYNNTDKPWIVDMSYSDKADSHDRFWIIN